MRPDRRRAMLRGACLTAAVTLATMVLGPAPVLASDLPDTEGPALTSVRVEPRAVDPRDGAAPVVVTARLSDARSGVDRAWVRLGSSVAPVELTPLSGTPADGLWSGIASVPVGTQTGPVAAQVSLSDAAGNVSGSTVPEAAQSAPADQPAAHGTGSPGAPTVGAATALDAAAVVRWTAPDTEGGSPVHAYLVTAASGTRYVLPATARSATVGRLTNGAATTFRVAAVNASGEGTPSGSSAAVTPRFAGTLAVVAQPAALVTYGRVTEVRADLRTAGDAAVAGRPIELLAQVKPSTTWRRVATAQSDAAGQVTLRATLPATSALRLHHPDDIVRAPDTPVRTVLVASRLSVSASSTSIRQGQTVVARGNVSPAHPKGSAVRLQRWNGSRWATVAHGQMTTTTTYAVRWKPASVGTYTLRVIKPADADHATGGSPSWRQRITPESVLDVARAIRANSRITLAEVHTGGIRDRATARQNLADLAMGYYAKRSSYGRAPGGSTPVDIRVLRAIRRMGQLGTVTVSEVAGGSHAPRSGHYAGRALDITWVNGVHVRGGSGYRMAVDACRAYGASQVFTPSSDPYGGHHNHVHCGWS